MTDTRVLTLTCFLALGASRDEALKALELLGNGDIPRNPEEALGDIRDALGTIRARANAIYPDGDYTFQNNKLVDGEWPNLLRLKLDGRFYIWQVVDQLLGVLRRGEDDCTINLSGQLVRTD